MSYYPTIDIINLIGMNDIGIGLREEYKSTERRIKDIQKERKYSTYIEACAEVGSVQYIKYLHENGCKWDRWTCIGAAKNGHIECLIYAHENGCSWDKWTCTYAGCGHIEGLR